MQSKVKMIKLQGVGVIKTAKKVVCKKVKVNEDLKFVKIHREIFSTSKFYGFLFLLNMWVNHIIHFERHYFMEHKNKIVGIVTLSHSKGSVIKLSNVGVLEEYRRKGYALSGLASLLSDDTYVYILDVRENNERAVNLYTRLGFKSLGEGVKRVI